MLGENESSQSVVLVVDDEDSLRKLVCMVLRAEGYQVLQARDGNEALRVFDSASGPVHVLVSDIVMPGMDGITLCTRLLRAHPELQVVLMSGYLGDYVGEDHPLDASVELLHKPFLPHELVTTLRRMHARDSQVARLEPKAREQRCVNER